MIDPGERAFEITPSDSVNLTHVTRGLYVGIVGDVHVVTVGGDDVTFIDMAAGVIHPVRVRQVMASGTNAGEMIGIY
jgi:hypothetical protein